MKTIQLVGFKCPTDLVRAIDDAASDELLSRSGWIRRAILTRLRHERQKSNARHLPKKPAL